eukprot:COSAG05_NODE_6_length_45604_cov_26.489660_20_plen_69_part_00
MVSLHSFVPARHTFDELLNAAGAGHLLPRAVITRAEGGAAHLVGLAEIIKVLAHFPVRSAPGIAMLTA